MPTQEEWRQRWQSQTTSWDIAGVTPPLVNWIQHQDVRGQGVLTPGCGRGYDAHFLAKRGAKVTAVDIAPEAVEAAREQHPRSAVTWLVDDVIAMDHPEAFDRIWEYTCFCALEPDHRTAYVANMARLLKPGGVYFGLVYNNGGDPQSGPPYPIYPDDLHALLTPHFQVGTLTFPATDSIKDRRGSEIWFEATRR